MKRTVIAVGIVTMLWLFVAGCGGGSGGASSGEIRPGEVRLEITVSPEVVPPAGTTTVTVRAWKAGLPLADGTKVTLACTGGRFVDPSAPDERRNERELSRGAATILWEAPSKEGIFTVSAAAAGRTATTEVTVERR